MYSIKQIYSICQYTCTVITHRERQHVVRMSVKLLTCGFDSILFCSNHVLMLLLLTCGLYMYIIYYFVLTMFCCCWYVIRVCIHWQMESICYITIKSCLGKGGWNKKSQSYRKCNLDDERCKVHVHFHVVKMLNRIFLTISMIMFPFHLTLLSDWGCCLEKCRYPITFYFCLLSQFW